MGAKGGALEGARSHLWLDRGSGQTQYQAAGAGLGSIDRPLMDGESSIEPDSGEAFAGEEIGQPAEGRRRLRLLVVRPTVTSQNAGDSVVHNRLVRHMSASMDVQTVE